MLVRNSNIFILLLSLTNVTALSILPSINLKSQKASSTRKFLSDQWDDEGTKDVTSYDDASLGLIKEKEEEDLAERTGSALSGTDFEGQERLRESVRARTSSLGIEAASRDQLKEYEERARARAAQGSLGAGLDLSKISNSLEQLSINANPEDQLSEEEQRQADEIGFKPFYEQMLYELGQSTFPDPPAVVIKVILILILGFTTGFTIIKTDSTVMEFYKASGILPRQEDIIEAQNRGMEMAKELTKTTSNPGNIDLPELSP